MIFVNSEKVFGTRDAAEAIFPANSTLFIEPGLPPLSKMNFANCEIHGLLGLNIYLKSDYFVKMLLSMAFCLNKEINKTIWCKALFK